jgi:hypothetical protein
MYKSYRLVKDIYKIASTIIKHLSQAKIAPEHQISLPEYPAAMILIMKQDNLNRSCRSIYLEARSSIC